MESYEEWDMTIPAIPSRSRLYHLVPIGVGTPYVEGLTSYITRLAEEHSIFPGVLISKMIAPLHPDYSSIQRHHTLFSDAGGRSMTFNGVGFPAKYVTQALESLTFRSDLRYLTLLSIASILPSRARGLMRLKKAWCPTCYEEWRRNGQIVYDPLLWTLQAVSICPYHSLRLSIDCPYSDCTKQLPGVAWKARVGYCSYCQRWLGLPLTQMQKNSSISKEEADWQQWVTKELGNVLAYIPFQARPLERDRISHVIIHIVQSMQTKADSEILTLRNPPQLSAFARNLNMSRNMIDYWYQGKKLPEIDMLLHLCFRVSISLSDFLFQPIDLLHPFLKRNISVAPLLERRKLQIQREHVYQLLEQEIAKNEQPSPSLNTVTRRIGHTPQVLYDIHPTACHKIVARYKNYIQQQKEAKLQKIYVEIRNVALQLQNEGELLNQKTIASRLSRSGILRNPKIREFLKEVCLNPENA